MTTSVLTTADLDELGSAFTRAEDPLAIAAQLEDAASQGRLADPADAGYAYLLASEIYEHEGQLDQALAVADRAIAADGRIHGDRGWPRAHRAELLFKLARDEEAMAELTDLRQRLTSDELAASYVVGILEQADRAELAMHWLTAALAELRRRHPDELPEALHEVVYQLAVVRHRVRGHLELPHDEYDELADAFLDAEDDWDEDEERPVLLWWTAGEYATAVARWPDVFEGEVRDWDKYRRMRQGAIDAWQEQGLPALSQVTATIQGFTEFLQGRDRDGDAEAASEYAELLADLGEATPLPPGRNERCWCGSGVKYKKCCLHRARGTRLKVGPAQA